MRKLDRVDAIQAPDDILLEYSVASCFLACVDAGDVSVLEHPGALALADM